MEENQPAASKEVGNEAKLVAREAIRYLEVELEPEVENLMTDVVLERREVANKCARLWKQIYANRRQKINSQTFGCQTVAATMNYQRRVSDLLKTDGKFRNDEAGPPLPPPYPSEITAKIAELTAEVRNVNAALECLKEAQDWECRNTAI
uniref:Uncharacterized protein n=1 Tax=Trichuris muris TaxID=70415 RepID=A0A5S6QIJ6_TRIMR